MYIAWDSVEYINGFRKWPYDSAPEFTQLSLPNCTIGILVSCCGFPIGPRDSKYDAIQDTPFKTHCGRKQRRQRCPPARPIGAASRLLTAGHWLAWASATRTSR